MNNSLKQFSLDAQSLRLTDDERDMGRVSMTHMFALQPHTGHGRHWFFRPAFVATILSLSTLLVAGGGVVLAAEGTVPGDQLYPVKVHLTEKVQTALNMSPRARARWEMRRLERRLEEAEILVKRKGGQGQNLEATIDAQAKRLKKQLDRLSHVGLSETADEVGQDAAASLDAHEQVLTDLIKNEDLDSVGHGIVRSIQANKQTANDSAASPSTRQAAVGKQRAAQQKLTEVKRWLEKNDNKFEAALVTTANTKLATAQATWDDGVIKLEAGKFSEAFRLFQQSQRLAQEVKVFLAAHQRLQHQTENSSVVPDSQTEPSKIQPNIFGRV